MYLTAQRVFASKSRQTGINAFLYTHGGRTWHVPPSDIPDRQPGRLERKTIAVPPPGNRVRSYLDIVAPDELPPDELQRRLLTFLKHVEGEPFPWEAVEGPCLFRIGMDAELAKAGWSREVAALALAGAALLAK
jgi:hypothetical protein